MLELFKTLYPACRPPAQPLPERSFIDDCLLRQGALLLWGDMNRIMAVLWLCLVAPCSLQALIGEALGQCPLETKKQVVQIINELEAAGGEMPERMIENRSRLYGELSQAG